jgi:hypothetical protein
VSQLLDNYSVPKLRQPPYSPGISSSILYNFEYGRGRGKEKKVIIIEH